MFLAVNTGSSVADSLGECAQRLQLPPLMRAAEGVADQVSPFDPAYLALSEQVRQATSPSTAGILNDARMDESSKAYRKLVFGDIDTSQLASNVSGSASSRLGESASHVILRTVAEARASELQAQAAALSESADIETDAESPEEGTSGGD